MSATVHEDHQADGGRPEQVSAIAPVFVLGMHRSGTSAFAGALHELGMSFGGELVEPVAGVNERGFFEDARVLTLHDELLEHLGRSWRHPLPPPDGWERSDALAPFLQRADELLEEFVATGCWGLKDPRLCLLFPFWQRLLAERGLVPRVLITLRHPAEVVASLKRRDKLPAGLSQHLWLLHYLYAEYHSRGLERRVVGYATLLSQPEGTLSSLADWLGLVPSEAGYEGALSFLSASLAHHENHELPDESLVRSLWECLAVENLDSLGTRHALDNLRHELQTALTALAPLVAAQTDQVTQWETDFAQAADQLDASGSALVGFEGALQQLQASDKALEGFEDAVAQLEASDQALAGFKDAVAQLEERDHQLSELSDHFAQAGAQLEAAGKALAGYEETIELLKERDSEVVALREQLAFLKAERQSRLASVEEPASPADGDETVAAARQDRDYHGYIDLRVENNSHTRTIRYINESGSPELGPVLEVGCSRGYLGQALRDQGYSVWGVETNPNAVAEASTRLDHVYHGTIEDFLFDRAFEKLRFQFVLFGDVIEHLLDPAAVLERCKKLLTPGGALVVSVPNVAHRAVRLMLLEGRWEYDKAGIMDSTHLHFYTRDSLVDLFTATGYAVDRLSAIRLAAEDAGIRYDAELEAAVAAHLQDSEHDVFQYVLLAKDSEEPELPERNMRFKLESPRRILCLPPLQSSSLYPIRLGDPLTRLTELFGGTLRTREMVYVRDEDVEWADTVVLQRESNEYVMNFLRRARAAGKKVIFDIDDLLTEVPDYLSVAEHARSVKPWLEEALRECDAISVSTPEMREALLPYNAATFVTPNYAYSGETPIKHYESNEPVRILVASSDTVRVDFLVNSLRAICADSSLEVELVGIGPPGEFLVSQGLPVIAVPNMPHSQFKAFLAQRDNTIALIPLDDNRFNRCKSAIKFFDYSLAGVPCICSDVVTYSSVIDDGDNGILCPDDEARWTEAIRMLLLDPERRATIAARARERCLEDHNLNCSAAGWQEMLEYVEALELEPVALWEPEPPRTVRQLLRGTLRHLSKPASYRSAWRLLREQGLSAVREKWRTVF